MHVIISPTIQWPDVAPTTETALTPIPIPPELAPLLSTSVGGRSTTLVVDEWGQAGTP